MKKFRKLVASLLAVMMILGVEPVTTAMVIATIRTP